MKKLESLKLLESYNLPVLPYKILSTSGYAEEISDFIKVNKLGTFMVRTDSQNLFSPSINNAVNNTDTRSKILSFFNKGYNIFIMHPGNTNKNFHSLNILRLDNKVYIEVVGPGFTATDLNRTGVLHEILEIDTKTSKPVYQEVVVEDSAYKKQRLNRITAETPKDGYLVKYTSYVPLSRKELYYITSILNNLQKVAEDLDNISKRWVASLSFLDYRNRGNEPIFWDVYSVA